MLHTWKGKPLEEMSREELIEALSRVGRELQDLHTSEAIEIRALGRVAKIGLDEAKKARGE
jgi:hypothetical protein